MEKGWVRIIVRAVSVVIALFSLSYLSNLLPYLGFYMSEVSYCGALLALTFIVTFLLYPARRGAKGAPIRWYDFLFLLMGVSGSSYIALFSDRLEQFLVTGTATMLEFVMCVVLVVAVLEGTRRTAGTAMALIAALFFLHLIFGRYLPGFLGSPPVSLDRVAVIFYLSPSGIFSLPVVVTFTVVIAFILFGAFIEKSPTGTFIIDAAYSLTGRWTGGPAKTAIIASAALGTMTGATAANVVTTGSFTIPLMKRVGYTAEFAGAVECVASNGGQIMPPVMGLIAFFMAEILGVSYWSVCVAALVPALLYYFVLYVQIHFEAVRLKLRGLPREQLPSLKDSVTKNWYYLLPALLLIYLLAVKDLPVQLCGLYALLSVVLISFIDWFRGRVAGGTWKGLGTWMADCIETGTRSLIVPAMATASAGIILGSIENTGFGFRLSTVIIDLAGDSLLILLLITAVTAFILGMGMTSTPCYLVLAVLVAPTMIKFGVNPLGAHLFLFYWGIASFITPPVAVAAYIAAGISGGNPFKTGLIASRLGVCNYIVPFMFVYFPGLLRQGSTTDIFLALARMAIPGFFLAVGLEGYFLKKMRWFERLFFVGAAIAIMVPGWFTDVAGVVAVALAVAWHYRSAMRLRGLAATEQS